MLKKYSNRQDGNVQIIILGSANESTAIAYKQLGLPVSVLVTSFMQEFSCGHTSPHDIPDQFELEILLSKSKVYWAFPDIDEFDSEETYCLYLDWIKEYQHKYKNIENFHSINFDLYGWKSDLPTITPSDCVFFGCSFTQGVGLENPTEQSYTKLVSDYYNARCINLGKGGTSNYRSFDLLSQIDFYQEQRVILQITFPERLRYVDENYNINDLVFSNSLGKKHSRSLIEVYNKNYLLYELIIKLKTFIKLARSKKLKFVFWLMDYKNKELFSKKDQLYFYEYPEFIPACLIQDYMIDLGTDNLHPGPESQKLIADAIIDHMNRIYQ